MRALFQQLQYEIKHFGVQKKSIKSVFIGGGTPSTVSAELYKELFEYIKPFLQNNIEITTEANPNSATYEWLSGMWKLGVNRVSFGVQSFDDKKLKLLNRAHSSKQAKEAINSAKEIGYENISLDLIYATAGDTKELLQNDLDTAFSLPINHLSAYALTIEENTPFEKKPQLSKESLKQTKWFFKEIQKHGFEQYEISNFGKYRSKHNLGYWEYKDYMGLGSGAVGKLGFQRYYPNPSIEKYITSPLEAQTENLTEEDKNIEQIFLGFRSCIGVASNLLSSEQIKRAELLLNENKLTKKSDVYYNPDYLLADELALFLSS